MGNDLKLRKWRESDCQMLYNWRIDEASRRWFGNDESFPYSEHQQWFSRVTGDPARFLYVLEDAGEAVAQIRLEPAELAASYRIAVATAPGKNGRGYGQTILRLAVQQQEVLKSAHLLLAETMLENIPSQKIFARQGFFKTGNAHKDGKLFICWALPLRVNAPLPVRLYCDERLLEVIDSVITRTGMGLADNNLAPVKILFDAAVDEQIGASSMIFHLNTTGGEILLDLATRNDFQLHLPIAFGNCEIAVLQIIAMINQQQENPQ